ncbi:MAG TPA: DNA repair protein RecN [Candidatus Kapabacteria bacterium]|nr:DNA repair protein RecN [Candidatus Kapabacteria bacterium]
MLSHLFIQNFALIEKIELDFAPGLNIITGETGAGKSVMVDALQLALGERANSDLIRSGERKAIIEAIFKIHPNHSIFELLKEEDLDTEDSSLILRRELSDKGTSRSFINDTPVQLSFLKTIGDLLADFHGQHQHQLLLRKEIHIKILDNIADLNVKKKNYFHLFHQIQTSIEQLHQLLNKENEIKLKKEQYEFELSEIKKIAPKENEYDELEKQINIMQNSELLFNLSNDLNVFLSEDDYSARARLIKSQKILEQISGIDSSFEVFLRECSSALISIDEISKFTFSYLQNISFDPEKIEAMRERQLLLKGLRKKYGTVEQAIERTIFLEQELSLISNFDSEINKKILEIQHLKIELGIHASEISQIRKDSAKKFEKAIEEYLIELGIAFPQFKVTINQEEISNNLNISKLKNIKNSAIAANIHQVTATIGKQEFKAYPDGIDLVEFFISTNKGEVPKPLVSVASGGEISRIMLALKNIIAKSDELDLLIFDEIDTGVSGRIATKVGQAMKNLTDHHQVIAITHLPQIAAFADSNILVEKVEENNNTYTRMKILEEKEKVYEVARLLSGEKVSDSSIEAAKQLIIVN